MPVRIRQIALVAQDIDYAVGSLTTALGTYVAYRDPGIVPSFGGMFNALLQVGDCFIEIVSPVDKGYEKDSTSVKLLRKNGGDCGYMVILQVDDVAVTSKQLSAIGRVAMAAGTVVQGNPGDGLRKEKGFRYKIGDALAKTPGTTASVMVQWHPKDFGTLMETEEQWPGHRGAEGAWLPAGNRWQQRYRSLGGRPSSVCEEFAGVEIAVRGTEADAAAMARKWSEGLSCPLLPGGSAVELADGASVRFVAVSGPEAREGVVGVDLWAAPDRPKAFRQCE
eukprot:CAMPEP_0180620894 /NCGR_PEP_ID=MMETSP1037_2-20121125/34850_1 /TAXON_ID=632150 /ORGANISM="Azadinium spinosum, Strain 3D9" /LENGTH=278 /DNA_ID=CAMNT_0022641017 /DNA_START=62 /DNA_END=895 /DNA_ORIENTATION=+